MPAAAVIPALIAYIKVVAVETLVVERKQISSSLLFGSGEDFLLGLFCSQSRSSTLL